MSKPRSGRLGRGLANLIPDAPAQRAGAEAKKTGVQQIPIDLIERNPEQPRRYFDTNELDNLAQSIKADGVLTPILVKPVRGGRYQLVAGERRWRASGMAGLPEVPALVREAGDEDLLVWALAENLLRSDLSPMETADALAELESRGLNHAEIGNRLGLSRPAVSNLLRLRKLEPEFQEDLELGNLTAGHARTLLRLETLSQRRKLAAEITARGLSVRAAEKRAQAMLDGAKEVAEKPPESPQLRSVRERFEHAFATRVQIKTGKTGSGRLVLHFKDNNDLTRILETVEREF